MQVKKTAFNDYMATWKGIIAYAKTPDLAIVQLMLKL